jgi:hypothetical protein
MARWRTIFTLRLSLATARADKVALSRWDEGRVRILGV